MRKLFWIVLFLFLLGCVAGVAQQKPTDDQLEILGLQADVQRCQVNAEKAIRKLQKQLDEAKAGSK